MNILIVGGAGYVGDGVTKLFASNPDWNITVLDNLLYEDRYLKDVNFLYGDIRNTTGLQFIINDFDVVIWLAAIVGDGACAVNPEQTHEINVDSVKWLVDNFKGKIVFPSTCSVYGINHDLIDETAEPNPLSIYAKTKLEAEQSILEKRPDSLVFRLGTLFGVSDIYTRIRFDLVANILSLKAARGEKLSVFGGEQWRPLLHVNDVANAMAYGIDNDISGLYNLVGENYTIGDIAKEIQKEIPNTEVEYTDLSFEDLRNYKVTGEKYGETGWAPVYSLQKGIKEIARLVNEGRVKDPYNPIYSNVAYLKQLGDRK